LVNFVRKLKKNILQQGKTSSRNAHNTTQSAQTMTLTALYHFHTNSKYAKLFNCKHTERYMHEQL